MSDKTNINEVLNERGRNYGDYVMHAAITQTIKDVCRRYGNYHKMPPYMRETVDMVAHKLGRILNGDPYYKDSWVDIVGYVQLVVNELEADENLRDKAFEQARQQARQMEEDEE